MRIEVGILHVASELQHCIASETHDESGLEIRAERTVKAKHTLRHDKYNLRITKKCDSP
jgi:hypothetical protein